MIYVLNDDNDIIAGVYHLYVKRVHFYFPRCVVWPCRDDLDVLVCMFNLF